MTAHASVPFLIHTKLNRPRIAAALVERPRLYAMLDSSRPLVLVSAPAGYGKTTLISDWVQASRLRCAWISLEAGDNQPAVFMQYLAAAIKRLQPGVALELAEASNSGVAISGSALARRLSDALEPVEERFVLVLDDYHVIKDGAIHLFLSQLVRYPPPCLKLVIAARYDPPLPIAAMRVHDQLTEIRAHDLRFTGEEASEYVARELEWDLAPDIVANLIESTEGWITGLHLATLLLRNKEPHTAAAFVQPHHRFAIDYLASEVLAQQPAEVRSFLLKTVILQRMCAGICDAVIGSTGEAQQSRRILEYLEDQDLFLVSLDGTHKWFRYHHLFQQLLVRTLHESATPGEVAALYAAASSWCHEHGLLDEAVSYALAGGNRADVVRLIERNRMAAVNREDWQQLERWVHLLPRDIMDTSPQLVIMDAWHLHKNRRMDDMLSRLDLAESLLQSADLPQVDIVYLRGEIDVLRSEQYFSKLALETAYRLAGRALEHLPPAYSNVRGLAWFYLAGSTYLMAGLDSALAITEEAWGEDRAQQSVVSSRILLIKCFIFWLSADLWNLKETAEELLRLSQRHGWHESILWARYFRGCVLYEHNELNSAAADFQAVIDQRQLAHGFAFVHAALGLASTLQALGEAQAAVATSALILQYAQQTGDPDVRQAAVEFHAALAARQGRLEDAYTWIVSADRNLQVAVMSGYSAPGIALVDMLIRLGMPASLVEAQRMLGDLQATMVRLHNNRFLIDVLILTALLRAAQRRRTDALLALEQAVKLAQPSCVLRVFLDAAPALDPLLDGLHLHGPQGEFVQRIRSERAQQHGERAGTPPEQPVLSKPAFLQPNHPDLIELLTQREVEVLQLLALRLTNKEIGQALAISTGTVKQHTRNVFRKLHADNRRDAIVQARTMGFQFDLSYRADQ